MGNNNLSNRPQQDAHMDHHGRFVRSLALLLLTCMVTGDNVSIIQSSEVSPKGKGHPSHFIKLPDVKTGPKSAKAKYTIEVDPSASRQTVLGFGGAITDSVATVFSQLNSTLQDQVLDLLWGGKGPTVHTRAAHHRIH